MDILSFTATYEEIIRIDEDIIQISDILDNSYPSMENCSKVDEVN